MKLSSTPRPFGAHKSAAVIASISITLAISLRAQEPGTKEAANPLAPNAETGKSNSFRGVPFGAPLKQAQEKWGLEALEDRTAPGDPLKLFIRNEETKNIGSISLREIVYYFFNDKFYAVEISTPDIRQTETLRQAFDLAFGARPCRTKEGDMLVWLGDKTTAQMLVSPITGEGRALIFNNDLQADFESYSRDAAKKAAKEF